MHLRAARIHEACGRGVTSGAATGTMMKRSGRRTLEVPASAVIIDETSLTATPLTAFPVSWLQRDSQTKTLIVEVQILNKELEPIPF